MVGSWNNARRKKGKNVYRSGKKISIEEFNKLSSYIEFKNEEVINDNNKRLKEKSRFRYQTQISKELIILLYSPTQKFFLLNTNSCLYKFVQLYIRSKCFYNSFINVFIFIFIPNK